MDWASPLFLLCSSSRNQTFHLQVLERKSLGCFQPEDSVKYLLVDAGGKVPCPGLNCSDNAGVIWYKMKHKVVWERELVRLRRSTNQLKLKRRVSPPECPSCVWAAQGLLRAQRLAAHLLGQQVGHRCVFLWQTNHRQLDLQESC